MLHSRCWSSVGLCSRSFRPTSQRGYVSSTASLKVQPLRILFCGSDTFSSHILHRLHQEHVQDHAFISSIDVVTRKGKLSGRGLKTIVQGPCQESATQLGLRVHEIPTFTGWTPPPVDVVLAVSFGLLVPPRILDSATYGGLNLHPSLLPDLRGPAPLHHTILQGRKSSGVTLQTLHPKHFDRGKILSSASFDLPFEGRMTMPELRDFAAGIASDLLVRSLRQGLYLPHQQDDPKPVAADSSYTNAAHARKLTKQDAHVDWATWPSDRIVRTCYALDSLWSHGQVHRKGKTLSQRIRWSEIAHAEPIPVELKDRMQVGKMYGVPQIDSIHRMTMVKASDGQVVAVGKILPEGCRSDLSTDAAARMVGRDDL